MTNATLPQADYMSVTEVAARLGTSKMTIYRLCASGQLASIRVGRSYRIPNVAYEQFTAPAKAPAPAVIPGQTEITA